jgi:hypothetical protein
MAQRLVSSLSDTDTVYGNFAGSDGEVPVPVLLRHVGIVTVGLTAYALRLSDMGKWVETTNGSAVTITIRPSSEIAWPTLGLIGWEQNGAGQITFAAGDGVTIRTPETLLSAKQYACGSLLYKGNDVWLIGGNLEAA